MTYIELLNNFWDSTRFNPCSSNETAMYFYLIHQCNIRRWINPFELKTRDLELTLGISRTTIVAIRNKLKQRGFIDFAKGLGSGKSMYRLNGVKITDSMLNEKICVKSADTMLDTMLDTKVDTKVDTNAKSTLLNEEKRNKTEDIPPNPQGGRRVRRKEEGCLFTNAELRKTERRGIKANRLVEFVPPTPEEVRQYFLSQGADVRLPDWEVEADAFFNYFDSQGWLKTNGREITNWDSLANNWIAKKEIELKQKQNEQSQTDRQSAPSRGVPIRGKIVPGCGLKRRDPPGKE